MRMSDRMVSTAQETVNRAVGQVRKGYPVKGARMYVAHSNPYNRIEERAAWQALALRMFEISVHFMSPSK
jgi:hypothetical protein